MAVSSIGASSPTCFITLQETEEGVITLVFGLNLIVFTEGTTHLVVAGVPSAPGYCFTMVIILLCRAPLALPVTLTSSVVPSKVKLEPKVNSPVAVFMVTP